MLGGQATDLHKALPRFDPSDPQVLADPYASYARLRRAGPLGRGRPGEWVVSRHGDVTTLLKDKRLSVAFPPSYQLYSAGNGAAAALRQRIVLTRDPPDHTRLRRSMMHSFNPARMAQLRDTIEAMVDDMLQGLLERGVFDAVADLASPTAGKVLGALIGYPDSDHDALRPHVIDLGKAFLPFPDEGERVIADRAVVWLQDYAEQLVRARRADPRDDMVSHMLAAELSHEELIDNIVFMLFSGFETTVNLVSTGCAALLAFPSQLALLQRDLSLVPAAVEEFHRWDAPIQATARFVAETLELGGRSLRAGRILLLLLGSANHDETVFTEPEQLDIRRHPNAHVAFGGGIHHCLGATLARVVGRAVFARLLAEGTQLQSAGEPTIDSKPLFRTRTRVPVQIEGS